MSIRRIFQTDENKVHAMLNLDVGINLAAIGSKLYLLYARNIEEAEEIIGTTTTTTTAAPTNPLESKDISITYPNGGEFLRLGTTEEIRWVSNQSINDAVKIDLYKEGQFDSVISSRISNTGSFQWNIPDTLALSDDYAIYIELLKATGGEAPASTDTDLSDGTFTLSSFAPTTTTTTTTTLTAEEVQVVQTSVTEEIFNNRRGIPLLELPRGEYITDIIKDDFQGDILVSTSGGRILTFDKSLVNAYLTGERRVFAEVKDGFGNVSDTAWANFFYALYKKVAEVNEDKEIVRWVFDNEPAAIPNERITGMFISPILNVVEDMGFWKSLVWEETKPEDTEVIVCVRSGNSAQELQRKDWSHCFVSDDSDMSSVITRSLDNIGLDGKYIQFKVTMSTDMQDVTPSVVNLSISYSAKFAVYFYTIKFSLENDSDLKSGLLTANITEPKNTEIQFGINDTDSADWNDYQLIELNKFFELNNLESIKIGIKMISNGEYVPEVCEFALMVGGEEHTRIGS